MNELRNVKRVDKYVPLSNQNGYLWQMLDKDVVELDVFNLEYVIISTAKPVK